MHYVYIIQSESKRDYHYVGHTQDLKKRMQTHNQGGHKFTSPHRPWKLAWYCAFPSKTKAIQFENYLKSGSGHSFRKRHLLKP
jgi:putative endonuclease